VGVRGSGVNAAGPAIVSTALASEVEGSLVGLLWPFQAHNVTTKQTNQP
jgi:hypothetical protein